MRGRATAGGRAAPAAALIVALLTLGSCGSPAVRPEPVRREQPATVHVALVQLATAVRRSDLGAILETFSREAVVEASGVAPIRGRLPIGEAFARSFERRTTTIRIHVDYLSLRGRAAYCRGTIATVSRYRAEGETIAAREPLHERFRMLLRREEGEWRIARLRLRPERARDVDGIGLLSL